MRGAAKLAATLSSDYENALLFRTLARLVTDVEVGAVDDWKWTGPTVDLEQWCDRLDAPDVLAKARSLAGTT
ncbi:MAG: hypothetical protein R2789_17895 [Microthrixaceae bacterium]